MKKIFLVVLLTGSLALAGCSLNKQASNSNTNQSPREETNTNGTQMANPASVNCEQKGGTLQIVTTADGSQIGICEFSDGSKCEEWAFLRNECQIGNKIVVYQPTANQEITFPLKITGEARGNWFFEASFPVKLLDANNQVIAQTTASAKSDWMTTDFVPFEATIVGSILSQSGQIPVILVLQRDNPSGLPQNDEQITIPLILSQPETANINVYFGNSQLDPEVMDCTKVFAVKRAIPKTAAIGRAALIELLKGPTEEEENQGYFTSINSEVEIQSLTIENGTAKVDFNEQLEYAVGGSCRVAAISSQIRQTLKQFPTVSNVTISIDGRTEDILQP